MSVKNSASHLIGYNGNIRNIISKWDDIDTYDIQAIEKSKLDKTFNNYVDYMDLIYKKK